MERKELTAMVVEACPSIALRIRREIWKEALSEEEKEDYYEKIASTPKVQEILSWQKPDGYFNEGFHGSPSGSKLWSHEGCVRYLLEMGFTADYPPLKRALLVLQKPGWGKECEKSRAAAVFGYGMIRAALYAQAGWHNYDFVQEWIAHALHGFRCIAESEKFEELTEQHRGKYIFQEGKHLPGIYHHRILAFTNSWRTPENMKMIRKAYKKLYTWLPLPDIYIKSGSQMVAPASNIAHSYNENISEELGFWWFHFYEMSARMGMLGTDSPFYPHFFNLLEEMEKNDGWFPYTYSTRRYFNWGGYSGLALEENWRSPGKKRHDLTFRSRLIQSYVEGISSGSTSSRS